MIASTLGQILGAGVPPWSEISFSHVFMTAGGNHLQWIILLSKIFIRGFEVKMGSNGHLAHRCAPN